MKHRKKNLVTVKMVYFSVNGTKRRTKFVNDYVIVNSAAVNGQTFF